MSLKCVRLLAVASDQQDGSFFKQGSFRSGFHLFLSLAVNVAVGLCWALYEERGIG